MATPYPSEQKRSGSEAVIEGEVSAFSVDASDYTIYYQTAEPVDDGYANVFYRADASGNKQMLAIP